MSKFELHETKLMKITIENAFTWENFVADVDADVWSIRGQSN